ncbi:MAG: hypothetical protein KDD60_02910 [Bdellovibrionales bacterium]|nr:hypothetical protein [Bdellovibrionales bacterium]
MVSIRINGEDAPVRAENCSHIAEIVELIKSVIDPDHMITNIQIDGRPLDDADWLLQKGQLETSIIEFDTGSPDDFVGERIAKAAEIVRGCYLEFRTARQKFQDGLSVEGNKQMVTAVEALQAFFTWYGTLLEIMPEKKRSEYDITPFVEELTSICKSICQQQLYQSWWALGESIQNRLEPQLDQLEGHCRKFQRYASVA